MSTAKVFTAYDSLIIENPTNICIYQDNSLHIATETVSHSFHSSQWVKCHLFNSDGSLVGLILGDA